MEGIYGVRSAHLANHNYPSGQRIENSLPHQLQSDVIRLQQQTSHVARGGQASDSGTHHPSKKKFFDDFTDSGLNVIFTFIAVPAVLGGIYYMVKKANED